MWYLAFGFVAWFGWKLFHRPDATSQPLTYLDVNGSTWYVIQNPITHLFEAQVFVKNTYPPDSQPPILSAGNYNAAVAQVSAYAQLHKV